MTKLIDIVEKELESKCSSMCLDNRDERRKVAGVLVNCLRRTQEDAAKWAISSAVSGLEWDVGVGHVTVPRGDGPGGAESVQCDSMGSLVCELENIGQAASDQKVLECVGSPVHGTRCVQDMLLDWEWKLEDMGQSWVLWER